MMNEALMNLNGRWSTNKNDLIDDLKETVEDQGGYIETWADEYAGCIILEDDEIGFEIDLIGRSTYVLNIKDDH